MITYLKGNLFDSGADCLVNTVNCEGFMGKGVAYQFKMRFPENNTDYVKACRNGNLTVGKLHYYIEDDITIVNFPTKDKWREPSKMDYIVTGMDALIELLPELHVRKIAIPPLGCGNGGLSWTDVREVIAEKLKGVQESYDFLVYEPSMNYHASPRKAPSMNVSALVLLDVRLKLGRFNKIRLQKTCYLMNLFLKNEYFVFAKGAYGPYSHSIDIVSRNIKEYQQYYGLENSRDTFDHIYQSICSEKVDRKYNQLDVAVRKATDIVNQIYTDQELEGVSTALYLIRENCLDLEGVLNGFHQWSEDKAARFSEHDIRKCISILEEMGIVIMNLSGYYELVRDVL